MGGTSGAYGQYRDHEYAHRYAYRTFVGDPGDQAVLHRCDVTLCVNPNHLFVGSQADNMKDRQVKGRAAKKLTPALVQSIRAASGLHTDIAAKFGIYRSTVARIKQRRLWSHVE